MLIHPFICILNANIVLQNNILIFTGNKQVSFLQVLVAGTCCRILHSLFQFVFNQGVFNKLVVLSSSAYLIPIYNRNPSEEELYFFNCYGAWKLRKSKIDMTASSSCRHVEIQSYKQNDVLDFSKPPQGYAKISARNQPA